MRKLMALLLGLALVAAACGDSGGGADPASIDNCDDLARAGFGLFQDALDSVSDMSIQDFVELSETEETPAFLADLEARGTELEAKQAEIGCTDEEIAAYVLDHLDELTADGPVAELVLEFIKADPSSLELGS